MNYNNYLIILFGLLLLCCKSNCKKQEMSIYYISPNSEFPTQISSSIFEETLAKGDIVTDTVYVSKSMFAYLKTGAQFDLYKKDIESGYDCRIMVEYDSVKIFIDNTQHIYIDDKLAKESYETAKWRYNIKKVSGLYDHYCCITDLEKEKDVANFGIPTNFNLKEKIYGTPKTEFLIYKVVLIAK